MLLLSALSLILAISQLTVATIVVDALPVAPTIGFVFFILSHTVGEMLLLLLLLPLTGPTIGSAFARTTFLPRQLRCDLTDLVSTWHFLPLLLLFMNF